MWKNRKNIHRLINSWRVKVKAVTYALNVNSIYDYENALHIFESVSWKDRISDIERQKNKFVIR